MKTGFQFHIFLIPSLCRDKAWIPVFTGMTISMPKDSDAHDRPNSNLMKDISLTIGRPFRKTSLRLKAMGFRHPRKRH